VRQFAQAIPFAPRASIIAETMFEALLGITHNGSQFRDTK
jgi:hypothetical protein